MLSNGDRNIELFRFDPQTGVGFIFYSQELQIVVYANGQWRFINEPELWGDDQCRIKSIRISPSGSLSLHW